MTSDEKPTIHLQHSAGTVKCGKKKAYITDESTFDLEKVTCDKCNPQSSGVPEVTIKAFIGRDSDGSTWLFASRPEWDGYGWEAVHGLDTLSTFALTIDSAELEPGQLRECSITISGVSLENHDERQL